jgi:hypothetical protein
MKLSSSQIRGNLHQTKSISDPEQSQSKISSHPQIQYCTIDRAAVPWAMAACVNTKWFTVVWRHLSICRESSAKLSIRDKLATNECARFRARCLACQLSYTIKQMDYPRRCPEFASQFHINMIDRSLCDGVLRRRSGPFDPPRNSSARVCSTSIDIP